VHKITAVTNIVIPISVIDPTNQKAMKKMVKEVNGIQVAMQKAQKGSVRYFEKQRMGWFNNHKMVKRYQMGIDGTGTFYKRLIAQNKSVAETFNGVRWGMVNTIFLLTSLGMVASPFVKLTKSAMAYDHQLAKIQAVTGRTAEVTRNLLAETRSGTPFTLTETSEAYLQFAKAGFEAEESAVALNSIMKLSLISSMDLGTAASKTAQVIRQFGLEASDAAHINDVLSSTSDNTRASVEGLSAALSYAGAIAGAANQSLESTVAVLGLMTDAGLDNQKSGTAMRQVLSSLMDPSEKAKKAMAKLGVSFTNASGEIKQSTTFLEELWAALKKLDPAEQQDALGKMFNVRSLAGVAGVLKQMDNLNGSFGEFIEKTQKANSAFIKASILQETALSTVKDKLEQFKSSFLEEGSTMANSFIELLDAVQKLTPSLISLTKIVADMTIGFAAAPGKILAFSTAFGILGAVIGGPLGAIAAFGASLAFLSHTSSKTQAEFEKSSSALSTYGERVEKLKEINNRLKASIDINVEGFGTLNNILTNSSGIWDKLKKSNAGATTEMGLLFDKLSATDEAIKKIETDLEKMTSGTTAYIAKKEELANMHEKYVNIKVSIMGVASAVDSLGDSLLSSTEKWGAVRIEIEALHKAASEMSAMTVDGLFDKLLGRDKEKKATKGLEDFMVQVKNAMDNVTSLVDDGSISNELGKAFVFMLGDMKLAAGEISALDDQLIILRESKIDLTKVVKDAADELKEERAELTAINKEYKEQEALIKKLASSRFKSETQVMNILNKAETYQQKLTLATYEEATAQEFIQRALKDTSGDYEHYFAQISKINSEMGSNSNAFEAWQDSINQAIKAEVAAGQELEADVSGRVRVWQTALMGINKMDSDGADGTATMLDDFINKLQLSSDIQFGGMRDDVENFMRVKEDSDMILAETSEDLISRLREEYVIRTDIIDRMEKQEAAVEKANAKHLNAVADLDSVIEQISSKEEQIKSFLTSIEKLSSEKGPLVALATSLGVAKTELDLLADGMVAALEKISKEASKGYEPDKKDTDADLPMSKAGDANNFLDRNITNSSQGDIPKSPSTTTNYKKTPEPVDDTFYITENVGGFFKKGWNMFTEEVRQTSAVASLISSGVSKWVYDNTGVAFSRNSDNSDEAIEGKKSNALSAYGIDPNYTGREITQVTKTEAIASKGSGPEQLTFSPTYQIEMTSPKYGFTKEEAIAAITDISNKGLRELQAIIKKE